MSMLALPEAETQQMPKRRPPKSPDKLTVIPYLHLDLVCGPVDLFGEHVWELRSPHQTGKPFLNTGPAPRDPVYASLSEILEENPEKRYYLSRIACLGILHRAEERGKTLPHQLQWALMTQVGLGLPLQASQEIKAYHINQRDEGIDLGGVSGTLMATSNIQMQTFVAGITAKGNGDCFLSEEQHTTLSCGGGMAGQGYPCALVAGFSADANAGSIGYSETAAPTITGADGGARTPSVLCLNDQGGRAMGCSGDLAGTLRAQEHGHQPLVYENHGIDARYTGPHPVAPTLPARAGTGGNNLPLVEQKRAAFSRQRVDRFSPGEVASTESARQQKDATDLVLQPGEAETPLLIRRLTPLECERLQGFPDGWTDLPGASDSARYKALGNSVAIPCVEFILRGIVMAAAP